MSPKVLIATRNKGKLREYASLLAGAPFELTDLDTEGIGLDIEETGSTLEENAALKATGYSEFTEYPVLADDSGLEVDALGGAPGASSARYAGEGASDSDRISLLLSNLQGVPPEKRTARFRAVIVIARRGKNLGQVEGVCEGIITTQPSGSSGFGYDPVFYLPDKGKTMAELSMDEKNEISHRGRAARSALGFLRSYYRV